MVSGETSKHNRVVIVGMNYVSILTMARDIGKAGFDVEVIRVYRTKPGPANILSSMKPEADSIYVKKHTAVVLNDDEGKLTDILIAEAGIKADADREAKDSKGCFEAGSGADSEGGTTPEGSKALLIAVDDIPVRIIDENLDELSRHYIISNIHETPGEIVRLMDKGLQKQLAALAGLRTARGELVSSEEDIAEISSELFPCYVKPSVSTGNSKRRMGRSNDKSELKEMLSGLIRDSGESFLVEEYIEIANEHSIVGISIDGEIRAAAGFRSIIPGHKERKGVAVKGITENNVFFDPLMDGIRKLMKLTGYTGMFDIDLLEDKEGELYFAEINYRAGASCHAFSYEGGINIPVLYAGYQLRKEDFDVSAPDLSGKLFLSEKALLEEYINGDISKEALDENLNDTDVFFIKDKDDDPPYKKFRRVLALAPLFRLMYRLRR